MELSIVKHHCNHDGFLMLNVQMFYDELLTYLPIKTTMHCNHDGFLMLNVQMFCDELLT